MQITEGELIMAKKTKKEATIVMNVNLTAVVPIPVKRNADAEVTSAIESLVQILNDIGMVDNVDTKSIKVFLKDE